MKQQTVLITGGSAGIGFEIAKLFSEKGHKVIITGRNKERLDNAAAQLNNVTAIACDVTNDKEVNNLVSIINSEFQNLTMLINNAGSAFVYKLYPGAGAFEKANQEMLTNYFSVVNLNEKLMPLLNMQEAASIINVSSIVVFAPGQALPTYSASKAALHSYTQSLRYTLASATNISVYELMPPLVNTEFSKEIGGENGIAPSVVAEALYAGIDDKNYEIHVGSTAQIYELSRKSPEEAIKALNNR